MAGVAATRDRMQTRRLPTPGVYRLVPEQCVAEFAVKFMTVKTVRGRFAAIAGQLVVDPTDPLESSVWVSLDATSFTTGATDRDEAMCGSDFLDVASYPRLRFTSTEVFETGPGRFTIDGELVIKDATRLVAFEASISDIAVGRIEFEASTILSRAEFDLDWSAAIAGTGHALADTVKVSVAAEFRE